MRLCQEMCDIISQMLARVSLSPCASLASYFVAFRMPICNRSGQANRFMVCYSRRPSPFAPSLLGYPILDIEVLDLSFDLMSRAFGPLGPWLDCFVVVWLLCVTVVWGGVVVVVGVIFAGVVAIAGPPLGPLQHIADAAARRGSGWLVYDTDKTTVLVIKEFVCVFLGSERTHKRFRQRIHKRITRGRLKDPKRILKGLTKDSQKDSQHNSQKDSQKESQRTHKRNPKRIPNRIHKRTRKRTHERIRKGLVKDSQNVSQKDPQKTLTRTRQRTYKRTH